uniref:WW domain-containing protein n=1 Tax=Phytophthora ramorum TaxID=164328 RepID=H3GBE3_PHYRM
MGDEELSVPLPSATCSDAEMTAEQKLYWLNALQVVGDWSVHDDGDGRLFYYDRKTDVSQWELPEDLVPLETAFMMKLMVQNAVAHSSTWTAHDAGNGTLYYFNSKTRESAWERPSEWGQVEAEKAAAQREKEQIVETIASEQVPKVEKMVKKEKKKHKKQKKQKEMEEAKEEKPTQEDVEEEEPLTAEELQAEQERKDREQKRTEQFRAMLRDKNIMPFCKWSVALPQIAGDPRFMGVPTMDERRAIFEHFIEHRREDLKVEKKNKLKQARHLFTQLLREQFQLDSWAPNTTLSVFISTLEGNVEPGRYKQIQDDALALLTLSAQEKIYAKAVAEYKSEALKRDGEQLRLTKFLEEKLASPDKLTTQWESDEVQQLVRAFYSSAASGGEPAALLSAQKQKQVFEELV